MKTILIKSLQAMFVFLLFASSVQCQEPPPPKPMNNYEKEWKEIEKLQDDNLTKSALEATQKLYDQIQKDEENANQTAQSIKALLFINTFQVQLEEDGLVKAIYRFETEIDKAKSPTKALLQSMVAQMYTDYLQNNIYKFRDRTTTDQFDQKDIRTWDINKITNAAYELYQASLADENTKQVPVTDFDALFYNNSDKKAQELRPTLYDFLAYRAIDFFESERSYLTKPAYKFYADDPADFAASDIFAKRKLVARDSLSTVFQAMVIYQKLLAFHANDKDKSAYIHADLSRIQYIHSKSILTNKDELYLSYLQTLAKQQAGKPVEAEINYYIALQYKAKGNTYNPQKGEANRYQLKEALELCARMHTKYPNTYGGNACYNLMKNIEAKAFDIKLEKINPINTDFLGLLSYQNLTKVYFRAIPVTAAQIDKYNENYNEDRIKYLRSLSSTDKWSVDLLDTKDYQTHTTEFMIPKLKAGMYIIVGSNMDDLSTTTGSAFMSSLIYVSDLAISNRSVEGLQEFYITNRQTGQPLAGVKAEFYTQFYNRLFSSYQTKLEQKATTDKNGYVKTKLYSNDNNYNSNRFMAKLTHNGDVLFLDDTYYNRQKQESYGYTQTHFFLDRAIYRPGQTVYFKGIVLRQLPNEKLSKIVKNESHTIAFRDANGQEVATLKVKTNEYGSFNGSFTAPSSGLLGMMRIVDQKTNQHKYFRVEEYKRPKFEVKPSPVTTAYKIDDSVQIEGIAQAFAGNVIDGAKVNYRVVREVRYPYWNWRWSWYRPVSAPQEIGFGETTTDEKGKYNITFKALADKSIPAEQNPEFTYTVYVDVIDITGETHSATSYVKVGYIALDASIQVPANVDKNTVKKFDISTNNLNGEFEAATGTIVIEQLTMPTQVFATRYWSKPDVVSWTKTIFKQKFPNYAYKQEDEVATWDVKKKVLTTNFDTKKSKELSLDNIASWEQGQYKLTLKTKDKYGKEIELTEFFVVYEQKADQVPTNEALYVSQSSFRNVEPDTTIKLDFGTFDNTAYVLYEIEHEGTIVQREWIQPKGRVSRSIAIEEKHRGGLHFHLTTVQGGRFYTQSGTISVPWSNKKLHITYETFRDKLKPGQEETWKLKIAGPDGEKVASEFLASMYDASLDAFAVNSWGFDLYPTSSARLGLNAYQNFTQVNSQQVNIDWNYFQSLPTSRSFPSLNWFNFSMNSYAYGRNSLYLESRSVQRSSAPPKGRSNKKMAAPNIKSADEALYDAVEESEDASFAEADDQPYSSDETGTGPNEPEETGKGDFDDVKVRTNLNETVFFYPNLMTDEEGNLTIEFTMNEALTKWKFMLLGHTQDLKTVVETKEVITQKELMVMPNAPRFFRENDEIYFTAKVSNLSEKDLKGSAKLMLFDAISMKPVDVAFGNSQQTISFDTKQGQSAPLVWKLKVPDGWTTAIIHRVVAKAGDFSDGEESAVPVLTNRMLVTETQPLPIRGKSTKKFVFDRMQTASKSSTLKQHKLTLEFTQNPAWYAVQSLPYLMEYPYECTEQIFSRYYANSLATSVANAHPKVKRVFDQWKNIDTDALKSNLAKNEELKYALLEETPWVLASQNEEIQKKNIGLLFDLNRMSNELNKAKDKLAERQSSNGGFSWFPGGKESWYITQYLVEGMGHLDALGVKDLKSDAKMNRMMTKAVSYIDNELADYYSELLRQAKRSKDEKKYLAEDHLGQMAIHYLYARTFFLEQTISNKKTQEAVAYFEGQAKKYALDKSRYMQGMLALALHRKGTDLETPKKIVAAARENALQNEELGMYWKTTSGYYWYELPIETHSLMIEMFEVVAKDAKAVEELKIWLLKNKQTTNWKTTKATASACYALLMNGDNWLLDDQEIDITIAGKKLDQSKIKKEAGTGYFKTTWEGNEITPKMAKITVKNPNNVTAWGAVYWQYFENLDKITHFKETPLKLNKKLFKKTNSDKGPILTPIEKGTLNPGDLITVRVELMVDRAMEYVHMKDMRASGLEPINVLSQYKYQGGLGYYESTKDASTNFFISYLPKGTYVFEYDLRVNHKGDFSNGITTIQCMYAPEFTAHSEGVRIQVK